MYKLKKIAFAIAALAAVPCAAADTPANVVPGAYIVELDANADVSGFAERVHLEAKARVRRQIDYMPREERENSKPYKAVSIDVKDAAQIRDVSSMPGVVDVHPVELLAMSDASAASKRPKGGKSQLVRRAESETNSTARTYVPHSMMQVDKLHRKGVTGKGIRVALIDTGVDYEHPALGGCFGPGCLVAFGADLVRNEPTPRDCNGHGTSVAGIIAAQPNHMGFTGAAPGIQLGMYRITCDGSFASDVMVDAIYRALSENVDIISSSAALPGGWRQSPLSMAASRAVESGVVFVQGVGNDAEYGLFTVADPATANGVISVAAVVGAASVGLGTSAEYMMGNAPAVSFPLYLIPGAGNFTGAPMDVYAPSVPEPDRVNHTCAPVPDGTPDLTDKLVLLQLTYDEDCDFGATAAMFRQRGALRIIRYQALEEGSAVDIYPLEEAPEGIIAMGTMEFDVATSILEALGHGRKVLVTASPPDEASGVYTERPQESSMGSTSFTSSWGPSWNLGLKPSLSAVGQWVISTAPRDTYPSGYRITSGTSMAGPLVAGIVALIGEARGSLDPATVESLLVSHAHPQLYNTNGAFQPYLAPVAQQGGGLGRAFDAAYSTAIVQPAGLNFNDAEHRVPSLNLTLRNVGKEAVTYQLSHVPAITAYAFTKDGAVSTVFDVDLDDVSAAIALSDTNVTVAPMKTVTIGVSASVPDGLAVERLPIWSGWIAINGSDGSSLSVPYQGLAGSIREHRVLPPDGASLSYQGVPVAESPAVRLPAQGSDEASELVLKVQPALGIPLLRAEVVPLKAGNCTTDANKTTIAGSLGQVQGFPARWLPNNATEGLHDDLTQFLQFKWNGRLDSGSYAPEGPYKLVLRALRILGNPDHADDWDVSETPLFSITYRK